MTTPETLPEKSSKEIKKTAFLENLQQEETVSYRRYAEDKAKMNSESKKAVEELKESMKFVELNEKYKQLFEYSRTLFKRYEKALWKSPLTRNMNDMPTIVFNEWRMQVYDKETGSYYALYWYKWLRPDSKGFLYGYEPWVVHNGPELWELPKLLIFQWNNPGEYELNVKQYEVILMKIENVLKREEEEIEKLEKNGSVDTIIESL